MDILKWRIQIIVIQKMKYHFNIIKVKRIFIKDVIDIVKHVQVLLQMMDILIVFLVILKKIIFYLINQ